uniref:Endonuclease/exonuclease/phosphatase domain-containing protein n=1 Tax=Cuerna arida TaxID=1464854 RepID=A0A1B6FIL0_9HEMI
MTDKIIFVNTQGFQNKKDQLNEIAKINQPLALVTAEHFQRYPHLLSGIEGYTVRSSYCRDLKNERGGVAIFVRNDVDHKPRKDLDVFCQKKEFEVTNIEIPSRNLVVSATYKPPSSSRTKFYSNLDSVLETFKSETEKKHVIAGDFNIELSKNKATDKVLQKNGFKSMLCEGTHDYGACLDNFIVDFDPSKTRVMRGKFDKVSDHHPIEMILRSSKTKKVSKSTQPSQIPLDSVSSSYPGFNEYDVSSTTVKPKAKKVTSSKQSTNALSECEVSSSRNYQTKSKIVTPENPSRTSTLECDVSSTSNSKQKTKEVTATTKSLTFGEYVSSTKNSKSSARKVTHSKHPAPTPLESISIPYPNPNEYEISSTRSSKQKTTKVSPSKKPSTISPSSSSRQSPRLDECDVSSTSKSKNKKSTTPSKNPPPTSLSSNSRSSPGLIECNVTSTTSSKRNTKKVNS